MNRDLMKIYTPAEGLEVLKKHFDKKRDPEKFKIRCILCGAQYYSPEVSSRWCEVCQFVNIRKHVGKRELDE